MSFPSPLDIPRGIADGVTSFYRFGENQVGTSLEPLSSGGVQQILPVSGATQLKASSTSANDTVDGSGGRYLLLRGLDASGNEISEVLAMNGTGDTAETAAQFWRLHLAAIVGSGTYGNPIDNPSYDGAVTVTGVDGADWAFIDDGDAPPAIWNSSFYTVPAGHHAFITDFAVGTNSTKQSDIKVFTRSRANDSDNPSAWVEANDLRGGTGLFLRTLSVPFGPIDEFTDIGVWGRVSQSNGVVTIGYSVILVKGVA